MTTDAGSRRRLVFLGTPDMAVPALQAIHAAGHDIALVVTRPDRRRGRGSAMSPSPVKAAALELGLAVSHDVDEALGVGADLGVVVAFGRILKPHVLEALSMVNLHFSLLPRWRGAAPLERAIIAGDAETGVCVMEVVDELDAGGVLASALIVIGEATAGELRATLVERGSALLVDVLDRDTLPAPVPQHGEVTYAHKLAAEDWRLDWSLAADELSRWIRAGQAFTTFAGARLRILDAALVDVPDDIPAPGALAEDGVSVGAGSGALRLERVQSAGKSPMSWGDFANGARPAPGARFGD